MAWINLYAAARPAGFVFFKAYVNPANNLVLGWVARTGLTQPYRIYFFNSRTLAGLVEDTRGSGTHAEWAIQGAVRALKLSIGIYQADLPQLTNQLIKAAQIKTSRGW